ncbi:hypothetical protein Tco_1137098 [Tanacetum coccineum]
MVKTNSPNLSTSTGVESRKKRLEVFIEEKGKESEAEKDAPNIKKGRSTSTSISIVSIADHTEGHPISIGEYNDSESDTEYTRIIKKMKVKRTTVKEESLASKRKNIGKTVADVKEKNKKFHDVVEIYSETDKESTPVVKKEKIKMVLIEKDLKKKGKLIVEDSEITKNDSRKKVKIVVTKDQDEKLIDEEEREDFNSKKFQVTKQDLVLKGGDRGACKLPGDMVVMSWRCLRS